MASTSIQRILLQCKRPQFDSWVRKIRWRRDRLPTRVFLGFPCGSAGKESACNAGDLGLIPGLGRSPGEGKGYPLQYSCLEYSIDCMVHGVEKNRTRLSNFHFHFPLDKGALNGRSPAALSMCTRYTDSTQKASAKTRPQDRGPVCGIVGGHR